MNSNHHSSYSPKLDFEKLALNLSTQKSLMCGMIDSHHVKGPIFAFKAWGGILVMGSTEKLLCSLIGFMVPVKNIFPNYFDTVSVTFEILPIWLLMVNFLFFISFW